MTDPDAAPSRRLGARELAGYRVLRRLGRDERAELLLGHRAATGDAAATGVVLKVAPATGEAWRAVSHECAALERARGEHVVELLDVDADDDSIRLVFERLPRGDLAELLRRRAGLDAGEAVTLLAPLVGALARLHAKGVAHGALGPRSVLFRDDGAPVLVGFSRAELFEPGAPEVVLESVAAVRRDRDAARGLAMAVLGRVSGSRARDARELFVDLERCADEDVLPLLAERLFEVAAAVPVRFTADDPDPDPDAVPAGARLVPLAPAAEGTRDPGFDAQAARGRSGSGPVGALARLVPEPLVQRVLDAVERSPVAPLLRAVIPAVRSRWRSWTPRRRRMLLAVGAAAVTVAVVTAVVPGGGGPSPPADAATGSTGPTSPSEPVAASEPAITGDDPVAAALALLQRRDRCLGTLSIPCLDGADERGSAASSGDAAAIRAGQQGGELPDPPAAVGQRLAPELVERLGESALVRLTTAPAATASPAPGGGATSPSTRAQQREPASLLLVKGEAGWRIRDVIAAATAAGYAG